MALQVNQPFPQFFDLDGSPLDEGYVYIGTASANPEVNAIQVYWDAAQTIPAIQPLRTVNGFIARNGTPSSAFVDADTYSCTSRNANRELVQYSPSVASASLDAVAAAEAAATAADASADAAAASAAAAAASAAGILTTAELDEYLAKMRVPIGTVFSMAQGTVPFGYLECNGAAVSRVTYSLLFAQIGTTYGAGDGVNTFNVPDARGRFVRGWDHGADRDTGRAIASTQADAQQNITGQFSTATSGSASGVFSRAAFGDGRDAASTGSLITMDTSTQVRTAAEVRPINIAMMYVIKAFDASSDTVEPNYNKSPVQPLTSSAGVLDIGLASGNYFTLALTENITSITFNGLPGSGFGTTILIRITQGLGSYTVAWPASFRWEGPAPTVSTNNNDVDLLALTTFDNGTKWDAVLSKGRV